MRNSNTDHQQAVSQSHQKAALVESLQQTIKECESDNVRLRKELEQVNRRYLQTTNEQHQNLVVLRQQNAQLKKQVQQLKSQTLHASETGHMTRSQRMTKSTNQGTLHINDENTNASNLGCVGCEGARLEMARVVEALREACSQIEALIQGRQARQLSFEQEDHQLFQELLKAGAKNYRPHQLKDPLAVISLLQKRIEYLQSTQSWCGTVRKDDLGASIEAVKVKQQQLLRVPFLEHLNPEKQREDCQKVLEEAESAASRIINLIGRV